MRITKYYMILIFLLFAVSFAHSEEKRTEICLDFRVNSAVLDSTYLDNAFRIQEMIDLLQTFQQDTTIDIIELSLLGSASPEGSYQLNQRLAKARLASLRSFIRQNIDIFDSIITYKDEYIQWDYLKSQIAASELASKDEIIDILGEEELLVDYHLPRKHIDNRVLKLSQLDDGKAWEQMDSLFFKYMRKTCAVFVVHQKTLPLTYKPAPIVDSLYVEPKPCAELQKVQPLFSGSTRRLYIKTNAIGLGLGVSNAAVELDVAEHWSVALPFYYSAWNYFTQTIKFRTLAAQPEVRYWFSKSNYGLYVGAHLGVASYNVAVDGGLRYQDHNGTCPALGGGLGVGYRMPINNNPRWSIEFMLGLGAYWLNYDTFYNVKNGKYAGNNTMTYLGVDNVAVNISYNINLKQRKR